MTETVNTTIAAFLKGALTVVYAGLGIASVWLLSDYTPHQILSSVLPYGIPPLLSLLSAAFLSIFVLTLEQTRTETLLFSAICFAFAGLNLDILLLGIIENPDVALIISRIDHFFLALIQLPANLHLVFLVCRKKNHWWIVYAAYLIGVIMAFLTPTPYYFKGLYSYYWGFFARQGILYGIMSLLWMLGLFVSIFLLSRTYRRAGNARQKDKIRFLIYGFVCAAVLSLTNTPAIYGIEIYPLGTFIFISLFLLAYGLYKYNLRLAMQQLRSVLFYSGHLLLLAIAGMAPLLLLPEAEAGLAMAVGIFTIAAAYEPLNKLWDKVLNIFFKRSPEFLQKAYYGLTYELSVVQHLKNLFHTTAQWLFGAFINSRCAMVFFNEETQCYEGWVKWNPDFTAGFFATPEGVPDEEQVLNISPDHPIVKEITRRRAALVTHAVVNRWNTEPAPGDTPDWLHQAGVITPVFHRDRLTGILMVGNRINDRSYSKAEKSILTNLGIILGPVIENARLLESLEEKVDQRTRDLYEALFEMERKNRQIAAKNDLITMQNHFILSLFETSTQIHNIDAFDELFAFVLDQLRSLFPRLGFGIILEGGRADIMESGAFEGLSKEEQHRILENRALLDEDNVNQILAPPGSEPDAGAEAGSGDKPQWILLPMRILDKRIGKMVIKALEIDATTQKVISIFLAQVSAVAQNKLLMRRLETMASTDGLTGAANRAYFDQEYEKAVNQAKRFASIFFSIIIIDINGLKQVNDRFGHEKGDEMIRTVAEMLKTICRETDILSRYGGDEFAILMPATDSSQAKQLIDRIRSREGELKITGQGPAAVREEKIPIRISIGLAGADETGPEDVLKRADQRMYADKDLYYEAHPR